MKAMLTLVMAAAACLLFGGCTTPSLNKLATEKTVVADPGLVGTWIAKEDDDTTYVVTDAGERSYQLVAIPKDKDKKSLEYSFQLVKLGETQFVDMTVTKAAHDELGERFGSVVVPAYVFMKVKREGDKLTVWMLKDEWLKDGLASGKLTLAHAQVGEKDSDIVLTATTAQLQEFFTKNAANPDAFDKGSVLTRRAAGAAAAPKK